jgi:ribose transport system substrate-binding protein
MKKKLLALLLSACMIMAMVVGCGSKPADDANTDAGNEGNGDALHFEIIVKSFQSTYWQAAVKGVEQACDELGVTAECNGPANESDIADQVQMIDNVIEKKPAGIGLAACDTKAVLPSLQKALEAKIPVVCFDTGVSDAPEGSVYATVATDNAAAGAVAAENIYPVIKDKVAAATVDAKVRIGEVNQDATALNIQQRGLGFIDKMIELISADGKKVAVEGNEFYVNAAKGAVAAAEAEVIIEVAVPAQTTVDLATTEAQKIMSKEDTIAIFGSNQTTAEGVIGANATLNVLNADPAKGIVAAGFDAGTPQKEAINAGQLLGSVTQSPLMMGYECIKTLYAIAQGETVEDIPMNGYWYDTTNMTADDIAPNLYD